DVQTPFTRTERIEQLGEIDKDISSLLTHLSSALSALATPPNSTVPPSSDDGIPLDPQTAFQSAQTNFFNTIDRVSKHLSRNIYALEEAGIISLRSSAQQQDGGLAGQPQPGSSQGMNQGGFGDSQQQDGKGRLEPDGAGRYGKLDVGRLNLASSTLERDKEVELWRKAREFLEKVEQEEGDRMQE
ncbi:mediator complex, subunit Med11, partial [Cladorrhinum samala]